MKRILLSKYEWTMKLKAAKIMRRKRPTRKGRNLPLVGFGGLLREEGKAAETEPSTTLSHTRPARMRMKTKTKNVDKVPHLLKAVSAKRNEDMKKKERRGDDKWNVERYTKEDAGKLGQCKVPWILFRDGYDENGQRLYDKVRGTTCHQCRQKTLGLRTRCSRCKGSTGVLCGDCLYIRYGENITEAASGGESWICPVCRGICNCSKCRNNKGLRPIPCIYSQALRKGYKSVAHYLIYTHMELSSTTAAALPARVNISS